MGAPEPKLALVTGAHGFLGRHTALELSRRGWKVVGLGHGPNQGGWRASDWRRWGLSKWRACEITLDELRKHAGLPGAVFHCAGGGSVGYSMTNPAEDYRRTVDGTLEVLEFVRRHVPEAKLIYPSSAAVYGTAQTQPIGEETEPRPVSPYGAHKKMTEDLIRSYGRNFNVAAGIIRFFSVYGPELRKQLLWDTCNRAASRVGARINPFFGTGRETRDWIHVSDAVSLSIAALEAASPDCPVFNGGSGRSASVRRVVELVFSELSPGVEVEFNRQTRDYDPKHYLALISKARSLGWAPAIDWRKGVTEYVRWYQEARRL